MFFEQQNTLSGSGSDFDDGLAGNMETMEGVDWNNIINQAFGVGSQAISAFSGQHTGTQIGYNPASQSVFAIQPTNTRGFDETSRYGTANPYANLSPAQISALQQAQYSGVGQSVGGGVDGIISWATRNPIPVFLGIAGLFLLMKEPPRRR